MKCTSAEAAKMIRQLNEELGIILQKESASKVFLAAVGEDIEELRPAYDYRKTQEEIAQIRKKIRTIKHALNQFNISQKVGDMTIDEVLVYLPQLQTQRDKLSNMVGRQPKRRAQSMGFGKMSSIIDYEYANYDIELAEEDYKKVCEKIGRIQAALDVVNSTVQMEIDL